MVAGLSRARMEARIGKLASFGPRNSPSDPASETRGIGAARRWIKAELDACARDSGGRLKVAFDEHMVNSGPRIPKPTNIVNVVATLAGEQAESRERIYVVSGHYDSMPSSPVDPEMDAPGSTDDASGTAVSMELACVMSKHRFDASLVFMAVAAGPVFARRRSLCVPRRGLRGAALHRAHRRLAPPAPGRAHGRRRPVRRPAGVRRLRVRGRGGARERRRARLARPRPLDAEGSRDGKHPPRERHHAALEAEPRARYRRLPHRLARNHLRLLAARA